MTQVPIYYAPVKFERTWPSANTFYNVTTNVGRLADAPLKERPLSIVIYQLLVNKRES